MANDQQDIRDKQKDQDKLGAEDATIDMPEVKDIPGQENIHPPKLREMQDITYLSGRSSHAVTHGRLSSF